ncbi:YqzH family protein [Bacillus marinisedimentorum]|uniref:YqzH family protein n=1 Tax=Bacillus marinisedimentorum TaxID=1821260 RepID=UPI000873358A|nr:YqzH family protein [Bacillus marinisedimentorum]
MDRNLLAGMIRRRLAQYGQENTRLPADEMEKLVDKALNILAEPGSEADVGDIVEDVAYEYVTG